MWCQEVGLQFALADGAYGHLDDAAMLCNRKMTSRQRRTRHEEVEERPELQDVVLDGRAAEHEPVLRLHPLCRLRSAHARRSDLHGHTA